MTDIHADAQTRYSPDFGDEALRRKFGPVVWNACRLMEIWKVPADQSLQLLGVLSDLSLEDVDPTQLSEEQMLRTVGLIKIYEDLHILHCDELADEWVRLPAPDLVRSPGQSQIRSQPVALLAVPDRSPRA